MDNSVTLTSGHFALLVGGSMLALVVGWCVTFWILHKDTDSLKAFVTVGLLPKLMTIILVVLATVVLAMTGKLTEAAAAILSGVVGYVLGTTTSMRKASKEEQDKPNQ